MTELLGTLWSYIILYPFVRQVVESDVFLLDFTSCHEQLAEEISQLEQLLADRILTTYEAEINPYEIVRRKFCRSNHVQLRLVAELESITSRAVSYTDDLAQIILDRHQLESVRNSRVAQLDESVLNLSEQLPDLLELIRLPSAQLNKTAEVLRLHKNLPRVIEGHERNFQARKAEFRLILKVIRGACSCIEENFNSKSFGLG